ncbi:MAG: ribonuclease HI family protein [Desulfurococcales archaeon]|nr:ribonuclease HI family protein [Desulfurococcales archaeon]
MRVHGRLVGYFDGLCEPVNPGGVATYGYVIYGADGEVVAEGYGIAAVGMFGDYATNNVAEYSGVIALLRRLKEIGARNPLVRGDSRLVIKQLSGEFRVRSPRLQHLFTEAKALLDELSGEVEWVPRERNVEADRLSRVAYEEFVKRNLPEFMKHYSHYLATPKQLKLIRTMRFKHR